MAGVEGIQEFRDFADSMEDIHSRVPNDVVKKGIEDTIDELKEEITQNIRMSSTPKGGTLDSRTSPYSPGTSNDSSNDNLHISDTSAWKHFHQSSSPHTYVIQPDKRVQNRAFWLEKGTADHGPTGDTPMHFFVNGVRVVVSDVDPDAPLSAQFAGEPGEVSGVDGYHFFEAAVDTIKARQSLSNNIERRWKKVLQEELEL